MSSKAIRWSHNAQRVATGRWATVAVSGRATAWVVAILALALVSTHRWNQLGPEPPGIDQGHWLAFGNAYWGQANSSLRSLFPITVMPPLVPSMMVGGDQLFGPETTSRILATGSIFAIMISSFFVMHKLVASTLATAVAVLIGMSATFIEPAAWGGYPQNFAIAAMLIACYYQSAFLSQPSRKNASTYSVAMFIVAILHHAYFGFTLLTAGVILILWMLMRPGWSVVKQRICVVSVGAGPGAVVFGVVVLSMLIAHYDPAVDASGSSVIGALKYAFPTSRWVWLTFGAVGSVGLVLGHKTPNFGAQWRVAVSLVFVSAVAFSLTGEARLLPPLVIGLGIGVSVLFGSLAERGDRVFWTGVGTVFVLMIASFAWRSTDTKAQIAFDYYSVLTPSMRHTAEFLNSAPGTGQAAIRTDVRGWPVGWWFRGLSSRPVLVGAEAQWLGFPAERNQAAAVKRIFEEKSSPEAVRQLALEAGVDLLVYRPRDWAGWREWPTDENSVLRKIYDDGEYVVLAVSRVA